MCRHVHSMNGKEHGCRWPSYLKAISPDDPEFDLLHDSDGYCLFHSSNLDWKLENGFYESFVALFLYLLEDPREERISFFDFHFVGVELPEELKIKGECERTIPFEKTVITKPVLIYDSVFHDEVMPERLIFRHEVYIAGCTFHNVVDFSNCAFGAEMQLCDNSVFHQRLAFSQRNRFLGVFEMARCTFHHSADLDNCHFNKTAYVEGCEFTNQEEGTFFMGVFERGLSFKNNKTGGLLNIQESVFRGESFIFDYSYDTTLHVQECHVEGTLIFSGTESQLLFNPTTILEIRPEHFGPNGKVIFDYCDLLNVTQQFLLDLGDLEKMEKVRVNPTCRIDRLKFVFDLETHDINQYVVEDFYRLVTRYFSHLFSTHLNVDFQRRVSERKTVVTYTSREDIGQVDFLEKLGVATHHLIHAANLKEGHRDAEELEEMRESFFRRLLSKAKQQAITEPEVKRLFDHNKNINVTFNVNELIMEKKENKQKSINLFGKTEQTMTNIEIGNTNTEIENKFRQAVQDVRNSPTFSDEKKEEILEALEELKVKMEKGEKVPQLFKDSLLSAAGSLASIASLFQGLA